MPPSPLPKEVSIIIPTYKEVLNFPQLTAQIDQSLRDANIKYEVIFVDDDSRDGSIEQIDNLITKFNYPLKIIVRTTERGLSSAVLRGFQEAKYETLLVMDADLQHNPIYIPSLVLPIINGNADFSVGSRHTHGGGIEDWPIHRKLISWGATFIARPLIPCTDPMSGFFALSKETLNRAKVLNPLGYKIGLELMVRCDVQNINEVPIIFKDRQLGESKLNLRTNALYLLHVSQLYIDCKPHFVFIFFLCLFILSFFIGKKVLFYHNNHNNNNNANGNIGNNLNAFGLNQDISSNGVNIATMPYVGDDDDDDDDDGKGGNAKVEFIAKDVNRNSNNNNNNGVKKKAKKID